MHVINIHENLIEQCKLCDFETKRMYAMRSHMKRVHTNNSLKTCEFCGEVRKNLKKHILRTKCGQGKNVEERRSESCEECGKCFTSKDTLKKHIRWVHLQIKNMSCDRC